MRYSMGGIRGTDVPEIDQSVRIGFLGVTKTRISRQQKPNKKTTKTKYKSAETPTFVLPKKFVKTKVGVSAKIDQQIVAFL